MLNIDLTFVWVLVNFGILYFVVKFFLFKKLDVFMTNRTNAITQNFEDGKRLKSESEQLIKEQEQNVKNSLLESKQIIDNAKITATKERENIINNAKKEAKEIIDNAKQQAEMDYYKLMEHFKDDMAELAITIASQLISENMDTERNRKLVDEFLANEEAC